MHLKLIASIAAILSLCLCLGCSIKKITELQITNNNNYPISLQVKANNCVQHFKHIPAGGHQNEVFDWTNIEAKDGQWVFFITNDQTGGTDSFSHGYFSNGELSNFAEIISKGSELKVRISE